MARRRILALALAVALAATAVAAIARWGEEQAYLDPAKPPAWLTAAGLQPPAVPLNPPPPLPPSAVVPAEPDLVAAGPALFVAQDAPPFTNDAPAAGVAVPGMRPLTLLDAKGGEYRSAAAGADATAPKRDADAGKAKL